MTTGVVLSALLWAYMLSLVFPLSGRKRGNGS